MSKAIPIPVVSASASGSAAAAAPRARIARRRFLQGSAVLSGVLAAGTPIALLAPSRAWAVELSHIDQAQADALMALARTLYPHATLPDAVYALVPKDLDAKASDPPTAALIATGVTKLDQAAGGKFASLDPEKRTALVTANQTDPFVQLVRGQCITSLYDNDMAYAHFGYQGEAFSKGGYIFRGFNDLTWLPNPPPEASPPVAT
ncbi:hypothetical protein AWB81_00560 [Caballeronia arationis]|jgi:hypothetical protein|uniref:Tat (Twin-arginine translocation) pathway signal sequence n=1 Tax=Caballeronia arationis TaxID=1777142 RepID=A0A7Z7N194_9BURK|nr:twin-arginine translocation signal domain-containing protein [Caballeronia arationis]SAK47126.1 hypothetical protein AWB81_00560 [Caballeronia arationis]SOE59119.1 Tat (twin-arginine translocation) pathway signal sequence [Caballeronia arationis]